MQKAPADYEETGRKFADALDATRFRGPVSGRKLRKMISDGEKLAAKADALAQKARDADRRRIVQEASSWKAMMSTWRRIVAAMPDQPELEDAFAFMTEYMSVERGADPEPSEPTG